MSASEAKILGHTYSGGVLSYEVETASGKTIVEAEQITHSAAVTEYWRKYAEERKPEGERTTLFGTKYRTPKNVLDIKVIGDERYLLCEFDGFDAPVLVRSELVRNAWPKLFVDFCEKRIAEKTKQ